MRRPCLFTHVEMSGHLESFGIDHGNVVRVGHVEIKMSLTIRGALLDSGIGAVRADGCHRADNRTVLGINHEEIRRAVT
jgi:hypothetical protein